MAKRDRATSNGREFRAQQSVGSRSILFRNTVNSGDKKTAGRCSDFDRGSELLATGQIKVRISIVPGSDTFGAAEGVITGSAESHVESSFN
jgi:hypothetical protein